MRHNILIPTDFSENAWSAAKYAIELYANEPCTFYFSHAWTFLNLGSRTYISPEYVDPLKDEAKKQLAELKKQAKKETSNSEHKFETIFGLGSLEDTIQYAIKKQKIDLVVMGTKGATGAKKVLFGSNTVAAINKVRLCPFLLVPSNYEYEVPENICFPTKLNRFYNEELLPLKKIAELHNSKIKIFHIKVKDKITTKQTKNLEQLKSYFVNDVYDVNWKPKSGKKEQAITEFIEEKNINILTMINYKHSFVANLIKEPIIKKMGFHSRIPFLVIPSVD
ncbi:nucleotide-binding universal stress UspA family protein [Winogradskyella epiphytica]|uniref:Nucleotide-binding universal stress UspA family protein n=1 Tax=Winogradskyella epiphytica TaxID=262005 RepID=A0A2V4XCT5_9FLAO|nr:universal stress protein [Winogradskyella epiphytica]PYE80150.1 nucleotide-binding universal stress UspA family protein [Winogradskyella epiphytica]GGW71683.1 hypothetical protein GCM10008085_24830 [Winogradskyella epiphytica]